MKFCHANNKQVIMRCCSYNWGLIVLVMFENFAKLETWLGGRIIILTLYSDS